MRIPLARWSMSPLALLAALVVGGSTRGHAQLIATHPTPDNLRVGGVVQTVARKDTVTRHAELDRMARRLRRAERVGSVGEADGDDAVVIGNIMDVAVDPRGRVLVADAANQSIRVFAADGRPQFSVGQQGSGPLDFRLPVAIWAEASGEVVVVDAMLGAKYLSLADRRSARVNRIVKLDGAPTGACGARGMLFAYSPSLDKAPGVAGGIERVIRMHDAQGKTVRTFGDSYRDSSALVRGMMSEGTVGCLPGGSVVAALSKLPYVHGFDASGTRRWSLRFTDFTIGRELQQLDRERRNSIGLDPKNPTASYTRRITPLGPQFAAVQIGLITPRSLRDRSIWSRIDTYVVDTQSGRAAFVSSTLPLLSQLRGEQLVGFENDPFPRVILMRLEKPAPDAR